MEKLHIRIKIANLNYKSKLLHASFQIWTVNFFTFSYNKKTLLKKNISSREIDYANWYRVHNYY